MTTGHKTPGQPASNTASPSSVPAGQTGRVLLVGSPRLGYIVDALRVLERLHGRADNVLVVRRARVGIEQCAPVHWARRSGRVEHVADVVAEVERADAVVVASGDGDELAVEVLERASQLGVPVALCWSGPYPFPAGEESAQAQRMRAAQGRAADRAEVERQRVAAGGRRGRRAA